MESKKPLLVVGAAFIAAFGFSVYKQLELNQLRYENTTIRFENSMALNQIRTMESMPNYDDGYRDAIVKIGGPQSAGSYQDGWDAAFKVVGSSTYSEGYHTAIKQFGYTKDGNTKWIIQESIPANNPINTPKK